MQHTVLLRLRRPPPELMPFRLVTSLRIWRLYRPDDAAQKKKIGSKHQAAARVRLTNKLLANEIGKICKYVDKMAVRADDPLLSLAERVKLLRKRNATVGQSQAAAAAAIVGTASTSPADLPAGDAAVMAAHSYVDNDARHASDSNPATMSQSAWDRAWNESALFKEERDDVLAVLKLAKKYLENPATMSHAHKKGACCSVVRRATCHFVASGG